MHAQPVGLSSDLAPRQVMRTRLGHHDLAVWRSANGVVSAWENRCPHRGMRLSHGFVRGESLACAYHGWHFSCEGQCHYIPAHPELTPPGTITPVIHSIVEQSGLLWVSTEGEAAPLPLPAGLAPVRSLHCDCELDELVTTFATLPAVDGAAAANITTLSEYPRILTLDLSGVCLLYTSPSPRDS